ncbi:magnesium transporter NIPA-domain-containing protein [Aspergillus pseudonomiae]|uniref:Magnesium transporter NIPA-domain-containing protein n=1 Tax=Aspergillus pseudonomiae TaxID=1506151 RepID=A0A5N7CTE4_9EURO|nr:magnesium transporter NIPA-domain-containing protein [Aspergillus pseudonomiae]KAB8255912.1 magnesium transporter NIPA-domain-containing protein [Aspergillus pseudonomiae]KAE8397476.1 magnesium transporter NIPA-domain-containing protein [Aspergillus pseudonomiae]
MDFSTLEARSDSGSGRPASYKAIGISLAVASGLFIGVSFVLKKTGLLRANVKYNEEAGEGYGYLKNFYWWAGMTLMIIGELCNFVAYAFVDAILVTPLGALSVVVTTILSAIFLKERLSFVGKVGCFTCILGSVIIAMNAPEQSSVSNIQEMQKYVITPGFLSYAGVIIVGSIITAVWAGPRYGKKSMFVYISICSSIGGLSVVATQGLGSAILAQINGESQFKHWFLYVLFAFVVATLLTEIIYLNKALNIFNAALVTPTYYVFFTSATIITSAILFQGFKGTGMQIATVIMGFLQICAGVVLLQLSKSAKDVPDSAVFKGDLDQIREVATQEEPETEPKADSIRGTAAIIRRISTPRRTMEAEEARRYLRERQEDKLRPPAENEIIEWDGLRRRKTVLGEGPTMTRSATRTPSVKRPLPPLGMSRFPDESERPNTRQSGHSFLDEIRMRSPSHSWQPIRDHDPSQPAALAPMSSIHSRNVDTSYPGPPRSDTSHSITWADEPPEPPVHGSKRQFSFHAFHRPKFEMPKSPRGILRKGHERKPTEEERLGLVRGDSRDDTGEKLDRTYSNDSMEDELPLGAHTFAAAPPYEEHHFHPVEASPPRPSRLIRNPLPPLPDEPPLEPYTQVELGLPSYRRMSDASAGSLSSGPSRGWEGGWRRPSSDGETRGGPKGALT